MGLKIGDMLTENRNVANNIGIAGIIAFLCNDYPCYGALEIVGAITIIIISVKIHIVLILNEKLSYCRETARQLPTWRGL